MIGTTEESNIKKDQQYRMHNCEESMMVDLDINSDMSRKAVDCWVMDDVSFILEGKRIRIMCGKPYCCRNFFVVATAIGLYYSAT